MRMTLRQAVGMLNNQHQLSVADSAGSVAVAIDLSWTHVMQAQPICVLTLLQPFFWTTHMLLLVAPVSGVSVACLPMLGAGPHGPLFWFAMRLQPVMPNFMLQLARQPAQ